MLLFVKPRVLKDELNARFREEHPSLPPSLTLSKIRSIKRQALLGCHRAVGVGILGMGDFHHMGRGKKSENKLRVETRPPSDNTDSVVSYIQQYRN